MSLLLNIKNNKYRFWNTVVDNWSTKYLTREQALDYLKARKLKEVEQEMAEEEKNFPKGWYDKNTFERF